MRYLAIIIICITCVSLNAQMVPGYQGKKGIISYQVNISPALEKPTFLNRVRSNVNYPKAEETIFFTPFNFTHGLSFERVLGRKFALAFDYNFVASKDYVKFTQKIRDEVTGLENTYYFNNAQMNIFGHYFVGSMVFYGKRSLAPFGKYFKISVGRCEMFSKFTQATYTTEPTSTTVPSTVYTFNTKDVNYGLSATNIGFSFGMNRIYYNRLIISRGIACNLVLKPYYVLDDYNTINDVLFRRIRAHDAFTFYLKIGYLL
ncbi:MAG: hypothetical protein IPI93_12460 [Sphingobacteriaceae bacterium]|nr:hypothetical protein [Sphingobacteriaceae bacterium]